MRSLARIASFALLLLLCVIGSSALLHDKKRGMNVRGVSPEDQEAYFAQHSADSILHRHRSHEEVKQHPDVAKFLQWKDDFKAGKEEAGAAFTGKIPHSFMPHIHDIPDLASGNEPEL